MQKLTTKNIKLSIYSIIREPFYLVKEEKGLESKNYFIRVNNKKNFKYIVKIYSENKKEELMYETEILNRLNLKNNEKFFPLIINKVFYINEKPSILLNYISGNTLKKKDICLSLIKKIAEKHAKINYSLINFAPKKNKNRFSIFDFSFVDFFLKNDKNSSYFYLLKSEIKALEKESSVFIKAKFKKSIIHEDLTPENIVITKTNNISFIDFGESHYAEIISDVAIAMKEIIIANKGVDFEMIRAYLNHYQIFIHFSREEIGALFFLIKRRTIFMLAFFLNRYGVNKDIKFKRKIEREIKILKVLQKEKKSIKKFINKYRQKI